MVAITVRDEEELQDLEALLAIAIPALRDERARATELLEILLPSRDAVPGRGTLAQARRNADFQVAISDEFGLFTAGQVARNAGSNARNASATANRWRAADRIFAVTLRGAAYYPGFQFDDEGQPLPVLQTLLDLLARHLKGWELAGWLTAERDELEGLRPVDAWLENPDAVIQLATWFDEDIRADSDNGEGNRADDPADVHP